MLTRKFFVKMAAIVSFLAVFSFGFKPKNSYASDAVNEMIECTPGEEDCLEMGIGEDLLNTDSSDDVVDNAQSGPDGAAPGVDAENISETKANIDDLINKVNAAKEEMDAAKKAYLELSNKLADDKNNTKLQQQVKKAKENYDASVKSYNSSEDDLRRGASDTAGWKDYNIYSKPEQPQSKLSEFNNLKSAANKFEKIEETKRAYFNDARIKLEKANSILAIANRKDQVTSENYDRQLEGLKETIGNSQKEVDRTANDLAESNKNIAKINSEIDSSPIISDLRMKYEDASKESERARWMSDKLSGELQKDTMHNNNLINARQRAKLDLEKAKKAQVSAENNLDNARKEFESNANFKQLKSLQEARFKSNEAAKDNLKESQAKYQEVNNNSISFAISIVNEIHTAKKEVVKSQKSFNEAESQYIKAQQNYERAKNKEGRYNSSLKERYNTNKNSDSKSSGPDMRFDSSSKSLIPGNMAPKSGNSKSTSSEDVGSGSEPDVSSKLSGLNNAQSNSESSKSSGSDNAGSSSKPDASSSKLSAPDNAESNSESSKSSGFDNAGSSSKSDTSSKSSDPGNSAPNSENYKSSGFDNAGSSSKSDTSSKSSRSDNAESNSGSFKSGSEDAGSGSKSGSSSKSSGPDNAESNSGSSKSGSENSEDGYKSSGSDNAGANSVPKMEYKNYQDAQSSKGVSIRGGQGKRYPQNIMRGEIDIESASKVLSE